MSIGALSNWLWPPIAAAVVIGVIGLLGWWAGVPWLFASLGPTVAMQVTTPQHPAARAWNVAVGHLIGLGVGFLAVYATGAATAPQVTDGHALAGARVAAAALAVRLGIALEFPLKASHPPAAATTLLIALGVTDPNGRGALTIFCGIALITLFGEGARWGRLRYGRQEPSP